MTALSAPGLLKPPPLFVATWHSRDDTFASSFTSSAFSWDENGASLHWVINDPILLGCLMRSSLYDTNPNNAPLWGNPSIYHVFAWFDFPKLCIEWSLFHGLSEKFCTIQSQDFANFHPFTRNHNNFIDYLGFHTFLLGGGGALHPNFSNAGGLMQIWKHPKGWSVVSAK